MCWECENEDRDTNALTNALDEFSDKLAKLQAQWPLPSTREIAEILAQMFVLVEAVRKESISR